MGDIKKYIKEILEKDLLNDGFKIGLTEDEVSTKSQILHEGDNGVVFSIPEYDIYLFKDKKLGWIHARICEVNQLNMKDILLSSGYKPVFKFYSVFSDDNDVFHFELFTEIAN